MERAARDRTNDAGSHAAIRLDGMDAQREWVTIRTGHRRFEALNGRGMTRRPVQRRRPIGALLISLDVNAPCAPDRETTIG